MKCCNCESSIVKSCICAIDSCSCLESNSIDCWCCIEEFWYASIKKDDTHKYIENTLEESIKNKKIDKIVREEFSLLKKDIQINFKNKFKNSNKSYLELIDSDISPSLIAQAFHSNLITKIIYFINELYYYLETINLIIDVYPNFNLIIDYKKIEQFLYKIDYILPIIVNEFKSIDKEIDNSFEYEMLKTKLYDLDELTVRIKDKIEVKTIDYKK
ncbi:hypothetical protein [Spiroplasma turonicum]|uniref:Uncharacterized protein n=1 Tax=Spiroplasma turonicum TaxID=216946 RepID=A0A0K1P5I7_9MOLU|nr:hypothetical protein [Spiroplasma turonicum]AKU79553.1 hypothetical protein STURON_00307 [Spiroplasma turonicum]ALX70576.1 hypothetical protein STURO_v1c03080 [Spiroplasma turonicum]